MLFQNKSFIKKLPSKLGEYNKYSFLPANKQTDNILTNIIPLGGTMKKLAILIVAALFLGLTSVLMAAQINVEGEEATGHTLTGTVLFEAAWEISDDVAVLGTVAWTDYNQEYFEKATAISVTNFDANDSVSVKIKKGYWTGLPGAYAGAKVGSGGGDSDLLIKVASVTAGSGSNGLTNQCAAYTALVSGAATGTLLVEGGDLGIGGIEDAGFILDIKVLMDWLTDVPGTYTTNLKMTVAQGAI